MNRSKMKRCGKRQAGIGSSSKGHAFSNFRKLKAVNQHNKYKRKQAILSESAEKGIDQVGNVRSKRGKRVKPKSKYEMARAGYKQEKAEKERLRKQLEEERKKRKEDLKRKREVRMETNRKLNQRTKRGQPIMANHIELLLEKIERG